MSRGELQSVLEWRGDLRFDASVGERHLPIDGNTRDGCSPMELLLMSLAGCMAIDVVLILEKGRAQLKSVRAEIEGLRAENEPRRFTAILLKYVVTGTELREAQVDRAIALSREKYCSVWHSMRPDIDLQITCSLSESS